jgi:Flp pilus assembly secretin CpaC
MSFTLCGPAHRLLGAAMVFLAAVLPGAPALAQVPVELIIDFARVMRFERPYKDIVIGNPGIADVTQRDESSFVLTGKSPGITNLIVLDENDREILNARIRVASETRQLTTVFKRAERQTFSCAPVCEQIIAVGDDEEAFESAAEQIQGRQEFASGD